MTDNRQRRQLLDRLRRRATAAESAEPVAAPDTAPPPEPAPPRREHLYGSTYAVKMSFEELMKTRGYLGERVLQQRRSLAAPTASQRQRAAAERRAGYRPGEVLWPDE
jgi:hypothetical protein